MQCHVLACDYDGTLAHDGRVSQEAIASLRKLRDSGRKIVLVTGRCLSDLMQALPDLDIFDRVVAENGALLYTPKTREERLLAEPASDRLIVTLTKRGVDSLAVGRSIIATWQQYETTVLRTIRELGLELEVIFNKGAVMILPSGINKATGLRAALEDLGLSEHNAVAIGDAENDHALFSLCERTVAVANAIPSVKQHADFVTQADHGYGVAELIDMLLDNDGALIQSRTMKHPVVLGLDASGSPVNLDSCNGSMLICGPSGSGKTSAALAIVEQLVDAKYQFCLIDPERDFDNFDGAVVLGNSKRAPSLEEVVQLIQSPDQNVVVSLLGMSLTERPAFFAALLPHLLELKVRTGRPHWIVVDEAHYLMPTAWDKQYNESMVLDGMILITVHPNHLAKTILQEIDTVISVGSDKTETMATFCNAIEQRAPIFQECSGQEKENIVWFKSKGLAPIYIQPWRSRQEHRRHQRKYAEGNLGAYHSFYFTGEARRLNLCANNLLMFLHLAKGIDDDTWRYHLYRHDYSRWFKYSIKDESLASATERIEADPTLSSQDSRNCIKLAIEARYSAPV